MNIKLFEEKGSAHTHVCCWFGRGNRHFNYQGNAIKNNKNSLFTKNSAKTPTKNQENKLDDFDHNTNDETSENENVSTLTEENISDKPKDNFSLLAERSDTLENFFLSEISNVKAEIKNGCNQKI